MKKGIMINFWRILLIVTITSGNAFSVDANNKSTKGEKEKTQLMQKLQGNPSTQPVLNAAEGLRGGGLCFTPNKGQLADMNGKLCPDILYKSEGNGANIYLRTTGISYVYSNAGDVMHEIDEQIEELERSGNFDMLTIQQKKQELMQQENITLHRVDMDFEGSLPAIASANENDKNITTINEFELEGYHNYYYGHCPKGITNVHQYNKVTYKNIYNNIDVAYYGDKQNGLKYDLIVQPHADPNQIKLHWKGVEKIYLNREGNLVIKTGLNEITESIPKVYQIIDGKIVDVKANYILTPISNGEAIVNFSLSMFNSSFPLVIDPWATYYGGMYYETATTLTTDISGNVAFSGYTESTDFPVSVGTFQTNYAGGKMDAFVVKIDANGTRQWATYYGGVGADYGQGISTDGAGNILVAGLSNSPNFPVGALAGYSVHQNIYGGTNNTSILGDAGDAFLIKLAPSGTRLFATYYGGPLADEASDVCSNGTDIFLYGSTVSAPAISTPGAYQSALNALDAFVVRFSATGSRTWGTYFGGSSGEVSGTITYDPVTVNLYIAGLTGSTNLPVLAGHQMSTGGPWDYFLSKFNPAGALVWSTYYGGAQNELKTAYVKTDGIGNVILAGNTVSTGQISTAGSYQTSYGGDGGYGFGDMFAIKFNSNGVRLWGTYCGGIGSEVMGGIGVDANNNIYLYGETEDPKPNEIYPQTTRPCAYKPLFSGTENQFIIKLNPNCQLICKTYVGTEKANWESDLDPNNKGVAFGGNGQLIAINGNALYVTGYGDFPVTAGAFQTDQHGQQDIFVAKLCINLCEAKTLGLGYSASSTSICPNIPITFTPTINNSCDTTGYKFQWVFPGGTPSNSTVKTPTVTYPNAGNYNVKLILTTACNKDSIYNVNYITVNSCDTTATTISICPNTCSNITATGATGNSPYTYFWSNGGGTTKTINACPSTTTTYTVSITDATGTTTTTTVLVTVYPQLNTAASVTSGIICGGSNTGSAFVNPTGGSAPYNYFWSTAQTTQTATGLIAGNYTVTVTDQNNCASSKTVNITEPQALVMTGTTTNIGCTSDGSASVIVTNGVSPFSYSWSNGSTSPTNNYLTAGSYTLTVTDGNGCTTTKTSIITGSNSVASATFTQSTGSTVCIGTTVNFTNTGTPAGTGVTHTWNIGPVNATGVSANFSFTFLTVGSYSVTHSVTAGNCFGNFGSVIKVVDCSAPTVTTTANSACPGTCATVTSSGTGGATPYTYSWSNGSSAQNINPCPAITTTYTVTIKDKNNNSSTSTAVVTVHPAVTASTTVTNITCNGGSNGTATGNPGNGTPGYTYSWSNGSTASQISNLTSQIYTVTITDSKGCTAISTASIISPLPLQGLFSKGTASCINCGCKEWILVNATGGIDPYSYSWSTSGGYINRYKNQLCPGNYTINIKDKNGCSVNVNLTAP